MSCFQGISTLWRDTWPGGSNLTSPAICRQMFEIIRPISGCRERIFHVHARDMEIDRELLYQDGILGCGFRWAIPRLPGLGEVRWDRFMAALYATGYDFVVSIEHEDCKFEGTEDLVKRGFPLSRKVLAPLPM